MDSHEFIKLTHCGEKSNCCHIVAHFLVYGQHHNELAIPPPPTLDDCILLF